MADDEGEETTPTEEGGKSKKLILFGGIGLVAVLAIAGALFFMMGGDSEAPSEAAAPEAAEGEKPDEAAEKEEPAEESEASEEGGEKPEETPEGEKAEGEAPKEKADDEDDEEEAVQINFGETFALAPFNMNLGNPLENRYLRLQVSIEYKGGRNHLKELEARTPQIRDVVVSVASRKTREFLLGPDGKDRLRLELLNRINQYMDRKVESVFITDILIE